MSDRVSQLAVASRAAQLSAAVAAVGVICLVLLYLGLLIPARALAAFGPLNDLCVLAQFALALPVVVALDRHLSASPSRRVVLLAIGLIGCAGAVVFQGLLLLGIMSFRQQVGYTSAAVLLAGSWAGLVSIEARRSGFVASSPLLVATVVYFGYPLWALRMSRWLRTEASAPAAG